MQNELKALIGAMEAERAKLGAAITALRTMQTGGASTVRETPKAAKKVTHRRAAYTTAVKAEVVAAMQARPEGVGLLTLSKQVGKRLGVAPVTIYTSWRQWAKNGNGADMPTTQTEQPSA